MPEPLADRFRAASSKPPLSVLAPGSRRELDRVLESVDAFEELPGKWQAALLAAEAPAAEAPVARRSCCGGQSAERASTSAATATAGSARTRPQPG